MAHLLLEVVKVVKVVRRLRVVVASRSQVEMPKEFLLEVTAVELAGLELAED